LGDDQEEYVLKYCDCIYQNQQHWLKHGEIVSINELNGIFKSSHHDWQIGQRRYNRLQNYLQFQFK